MNINLGKSLNVLTKTTIEFVKKNAPQILMGISVTAGALATVFSIKGTIKAVEIVEKKKKEENKDTLTTWETVKCVWPYYIPTGIALGVEAFTGVKSVGVSLARQAVTSSLLLAKTSELDDYKKATKKLLGNKKEEEIHNEAKKEKATRLMQQEGYEFQNTGHGNTKFIDDATGQGFKASRNFIDKVVNGYQYRINNEGYTVNFNDILRDIGLRTASLANHMVWDADCPPIGVYITWIDDPDGSGEPVGVVEFHNFRNDLPWD